MFPIDPSWPVGFFTSFALLGLLMVYGVGQILAIHSVITLLHLFSHFL